MGTIYKRGETYWADYWHRGERVRISLRTKDRAVAKARLRDAELGATGEAATAPKALGTAVDEMVSLKRGGTAESYKFKANHLFAVLGADTDINTLSRADVADYAVKRLKAGAHRHTIHKELVVLRQALKEARARGEFAGSLEIVPAWKAEYEPRRRWLTPAEFKRLLGAVDPSHRTWLMVQAYTGAELGAMKRLTWDHVGLERSVMTIPGTKTSARHRESVPLHPELKAWLRKLPRTELLIEPWPGVARDLRRACAAAKIIPAATTHDLRRTFGSWLVQAGVDIVHVARLMGNSPAVAARVYGQTSDASYLVAINKLPRLPRGKDPAP